MKDNQIQNRLLVIGGGAAGIFCAVNAARMNPTLNVTLLEKTSKLLSKVRISGGGRCNLTHACFDIGEMSRKYPRGNNFVKKTFHQFFTTDTIEWFQERGVETKTESDGRMFPVTDSSQTIINCLLKEVDRYKVEITTNCEVISINNSNQTFQVETSKGLQISNWLCIACGGYPKTSMFSWLTALGHSIEEPVPSLFTFNMQGNPITQLMGITVENARIRINETKLIEEGPLLITHWGMSGPTILRLSAWGARELKNRNWNFSITINWLPEWNDQELRNQIKELRISLAAKKIWTKNPFKLPARLWEFLLEHATIHLDTRWADLSTREQNLIIASLNAFHCEVKGKTTFKEEFVTAGGIRLNEVDANTMMSKKMARLCFAGEILDVDGITGGFNFQHAWTSAFIAAKTISNSTV